MGVIKKIKLQDISQYHNLLCELFSQHSVQSSKNMYKKRNQDKIQKVEQDIYYGKVAEFMVYNFFKSKNLNVTFPDIEIYKPHEKSYDPDLYVNNKKIHVKTYLNVNRTFDPSWVFTIEDELINSKNKNDILALCSIRENNNYMYLLSVNDINFKDPILEKLIGIKKCIYEKDIIEKLKINNNG